MHISFHVHNKPLRLSYLMSPLNQNQRTLALANAVLIATFATVTGYAQTAGERVVVTANIDTKIYKEKVDKVYTGDIHTVIAVNGKWCALSRVKGWLPARYVISLQSAKQLYDKRIRDDEND